MHQFKLSSEYVIISISLWKTATSDWRYPDHVYRCSPLHVRSLGSLSSFSRRYAAMAQLATAVKKPIPCPPFLTPSGDSVLDEIKHLGISKHCGGTAEDVSQKSDANSTIVGFLPPMSLLRRLQRCARLQASRVQLRNPRDVARPIASKTTFWGVNFRDENQ
jgi:hypothetical protein